MQSNKLSKNEVNNLGVFKRLLCDGARVAFLEKLN